MGRSLLNELWRGAKMEIDVTNRIQYNTFESTNDKPRGWYLDISNVPSGCDIKFKLCGDSNIEIFNKLLNLKIIK